MFSTRLIVQGQVSVHEDNNLLVVGYIPDIFLINHQIPVVSIYSQPRLLHGLAGISQVLRFIPHLGVKVGIVFHGYAHPQPHCLRSTAPAILTVNIHPTRSTGHNLPAISQSKAWAVHSPCRVSRNQSRRTQGSGTGIKRNVAFNTAKGERRTTQRLEPGRVAGVG